MKLINRSESSMVKFYLNVTRKRVGWKRFFSFDFQNSTKLFEIYFMCVFGWGQSIIGKRVKKRINLKFI